MKEYSFDEIKQMQARLSPSDIPKLIVNRRDWMYHHELVNLLLFNFPKLGEDKQNRKRARAFIEIAVSLGIIERNVFPSMNTELYRIVELKAVQNEATPATAEPTV